MKKILILCVALVMLMGSVCSATPVRVFDGGVNDFVTLYNQMAQEVYNHSKIDMKLYQRPIKNPVASYDTYTAYMSKVGNTEKLPAYITLYVDKSGYIHQLYITGFLNDLKTKTTSEKMFVGTLTLALTMAGVDNFHIDEWFMDGVSMGLLEDGKNEYSMPSLKKRRIHVHSQQVGIVGKNKQYGVRIFADSN